MSKYPDYPAPFGATNPYGSLGPNWEKVQEVMNRVESLDESEILAMELYSKDQKIEELIEAGERCRKAAVSRGLADVWLRIGLRVEESCHKFKLSDNVADIVKQCARGECVNGLVAPVYMEAYKEPWEQALLLGAEIKCLTDLERTTLRNLAATCEGNSRELLLAAKDTCATGAANLT